MADYDYFDSLPPNERRKLNRAIKQRAAADLLKACEGDEFFSSLVAFSIQTLMAEDLDLVDLENHREKLVKFVQRLQGHRDAFHGYPWTRFPRDLAYNGHLAEMTAGEAKVYLALLALCDPRTLVTCASLATIAEMAGRSPHTVSKNLTRLKKRGLIRRWCIRHPDARDEDHYLWFTRVVPDRCVETEPERTRLHETATLPTIGE